MYKNLQSIAKKCAYIILIKASRVYFVRGDVEFLYKDVVMEFRFSSFYREAISSSSHQTAFGTYCKITNNSTKHALNNLKKLSNIISNLLNISFKATSKEL